MIVKKLQDEQINSLKSGDKTRLEIIRYILAQIKNREIDKKEDLTDEEVITVLKKIAKELKESIEASQKGQREDLSTGYQKQLGIVNEYLPAEISDEELKKEIDALIDKNKDLYTKNPKSIIGICVKELRSKADPSRIMKILATYESA
jgi:uncharacterized protein